MALLSFDKSVFCELMAQVKLERDSRQPELKSNFEKH